MDWWIFFLPATWWKRHLDATDEGFWMFDQRTDRDLALTFSWVCFFLPCLSTSSLIGASCLYCVLWIESLHFWWKLSPMHGEAEPAHLGHFWPLPEAEKGSDSVFQSLPLLWGSGFLGFILCVFFKGEFAGSASGFEFFFHTLPYFLWTARQESRSFSLALPEQMNQHAQDQQHRNY